MCQRRHHACLKIGKCRHALWRDITLHPLHQAGTQLAKVLFVALGRGGLHQLARMHRSNHRFAVVLIQTWPKQCRPCILQTLLNAIERLCMTSQCAGDDRIKLQALCTPMLTQALALLRTQRAELVVVCRAQRGLPMSHQIKLTHAFLPK